MFPSNPSPRNHCGSFRLTTGQQSTLTAATLCAFLFLLCVVALLSLFSAFNYRIAQARNT